MVSHATIHLSDIKKKVYATLYKQFIFNNMSLSDRDSKSYWVGYFTLPVI